MKRFIAKLLGLYTDRDLVTFGNYLILNRAQATWMEAIEAKANLDKLSTPKAVSHADMCNWEFEQKHGTVI
ncbi:hypothetical protein [Chitinophaga sp.]|uniref:hypothetical protein n=1 Tax=Chitinophaga sp. TaxID=1869181 RepID=UPI002BBAC31E|nr:hypothetical protein [Chitinophaga sp.]HWV64360.1 hypothetical protein [Chitinophaga sp.]